MVSHYLKKLNLIKINCGEHLEMESLPQTGACVLKQGVSTI